MEILNLLLLGQNLRFVWKKHIADLNFSCVICCDFITLVPKLIETLPGVLSLIRSYDCAPYLRALIMQVVKTVQAQGNTW